MTNVFDSQALVDLIRKQEQGIGSGVTVKKAMLNTAVSRCVHLISFAIGYLPLHLIDKAEKQKAREHPLFSILHKTPNDWQTAFNFRQLMQRRALVNGNAYALIVRSGNRVVRLVPLDPLRVKPVQKKDWTVEYHYSASGKAKKILKPHEILHVYADSEDGISGLSMVQVAANAINLAEQADNAAKRLFENGMMVGGALSHPGSLSPDARVHLEASMKERHAGADNAGKWMVLEEGMTAAQFASTAHDAQQLETRKHQVEEIGRAFGVPRPFLGLDDTSWGSGVDVLGQIFVRYALNPWFTAWEQAVDRSCLTDSERDQFGAKFNDGALIRGNMKDQAEFWAKALGSGGHQPWMTYQEVREISDLPDQEIAPNPLAIKKETANEPTQTSRD